MDNFFKTVLTSSMGNDLQAGGAEQGWWQLSGWAQLLRAISDKPDCYLGMQCLLPLPAHACQLTQALPCLPPPPSPHVLQNKDLALPQHSDRAHKLLADNETTVHMSYDVSGQQKEEGVCMMCRAAGHEEMSTVHKVIGGAEKWGAHTVRPPPICSQVY